MNSTSSLRLSQYRIVFYGLGEIGVRALRMALKCENVSVVGAVDTDPSKIGQDLGHFAGLEHRTGVAVSADAEKLLSSSGPDIVIHSTNSLIEDIAPQIRGIVSAGANCISSAEELFYPRPDTRKYFEALHEAATVNGVSVLGTGVNPGYVMDGLPLFLSKTCEEVRSVKVERVVDAATRRLPLQRKVGMGLDPNEFIKLVKEHRMGHRGLIESMYSLAGGLGWNLERVEEEVVPVVAQERVRTEFFTVEAGQTMGMKHRGYGFRDGEKVIILDLRMYVSPRKAFDRITLDGVPPIEVTVKGGVPGDGATASILIHSVPSVVNAKPGLMNLQPIPFIHTIFSQIPELSREE
jgi:4-hydroxy-tetrahydrodipicolinate reductase